MVVLYLSTVLSERKYFLMCHPKRSYCPTQAGAETDGIREGNKTGIHIQKECNMKISLNEVRGNRSTPTSKPSYQTLGQKVIDILQISHAGYLSG
jgi:hypothetical protein